MDDARILLKNLQDMEDEFEATSVEEELLAYIAAMSGSFADAPNMIEAFKSQNINPHAILAVLILLTTYFSYRVASKEIKGTNSKEQFSVLIDDIRQVVTEIERESAEGHA